MLSQYTENELIAHIQQMRAIHWLANREEDLAILCGFKKADTATYERLLTELRMAGLGELGVIAACQYTKLIETMETYK